MEVVAEEVNVDAVLAFHPPKYHKYRCREVGGGFIFYQKIVSRTRLIVVYARFKIARYFI
jgi:hypothetical protein